MAEYAQIHSMADRLHQYAPEAKVITSFYRGPEDGDNVDDLFAVFDILDGATSIFCTGVWSLQGNESRSAMCRKKIEGGSGMVELCLYGGFPGAGAKFVRCRKPCRDVAPLEGADHGISILGG